MNRETEILTGEIRELMYEVRNIGEKIKEFITIYKIVSQEEKELRDFSLKTVKNINESMNRLNEISGDIM